MAFGLTPFNLERTLNNYTRTSNFNASANKAVDLFEKNLVATGSKFGNTAGQSIGGFESLTSSLDDIVQTFDESIPIQSFGNLDIVTLSADVPGLPSFKQKLVDSDSTDLIAITGDIKNIDPGFLNVRITSGFPEAIAEVLLDLGASSNVIRNVVSDLQNVESGLLEKIETPIDELMDQVLGPILNVSNNIENLKNQVFDEFSTLTNNILNTNNAGFGSVVENAVEHVTGNAKTVVKELVAKYNDVPLSSKDVSEVVKLVAEGNFKSAAEIVKSQTPGATESEIITTLKTIDSRLTSNLNPVNTGGVNIPVNKIDDYGKNYKGPNTKVSNVASKDNTGHQFSFIGSREELEVEFKSIEREITELIVHWTETHTNQDIGSEEIQQTSGDIPYHYIIRRNGDIQRGKPIESLGGLLANGHEKYAIQIAFVGGINCPSGVKNIEQFFSLLSLTRIQMSSFEDICAVAYSAMPGIQIMGHNDVDRTQFDPGFDVVNFTENAFNKTIVYKDPSSVKPKNRIEIIREQVPYL